MIYIGLMTILKAKIELAWTAEDEIYSLFEKC